MALQHRYNGKTKFIIVTGGVISGLGKGVAAASIGALLSARMKVVMVKFLFWMTVANAIWTSATMNAF